MNSWEKISCKAYPFTLFKALCLLVLMMVCGCGGDGNSGMDEKVLIRVGGSVVTVRTFHEAFESSITSPSQLFQDPEALRDKKYRILNRLSEELLVLERARELDLKVSDEETARVVNDFKNDFPDDTFEKTLLENGISFLVWEKALKRRLLMEKVIRHDLAEGSLKTPLAPDEEKAAENSESPPENEAVNTVNPEESILPEKAVNANNSEENPTPGKAVETDDSGKNADSDTAVNTDDSKGDPPADNEKFTGIPTPIITAEAKYPDWIKRLKQQYTIEIDWKLWETIVQEQSDGV